MDIGTRATCGESKLPVIDDQKARDMSFASEPWFFHLYGGGYKTTMRIWKLIAK